MAVLTIGALGVVFGDIGTSPLYALQTVFHADHGSVPTSQSAVYGVLSLVFWAITIIVSIKYLTFIMRADNDGEGGIMALIALIQRAGLPRRSTRVALISLGIFGAALFYGDGMITPAISVLSAVEGLEVDSPSLDSLVAPIALTILTALFVIQRFGTGAVGSLFGPVMGLWFAVLAIAGVAKVAEHPSALQALSPSYAVDFFIDHGGTAFVALGSVVLAVTGAEALYADMGHFGRRPIRRAWFFLVFPALTLKLPGPGRADRRGSRLVGFGASTALASAYGIAVTGTLAIDTLLFFFVVRFLWKKPLWLVISGAVAFLIVDLAFFSANLTKVLHGGWFPLVIAIGVFVVLTTWQKGREIVTRNRTEEEGTLRAFVDEIRSYDPPVYRSPGTAVFLNANKDTTPLAMRATVEHSNALHRNVVIVSIDTLKVPNVAENEQVAVDDLGYRDDGISHVIARVGFQDEIDVPRMLALAVARGLEGNCDVDRASYFLSRMTIVPTDAPTMHRWRKKLFMAVARNASNPVSYFRLPDDRTVVMGSHVTF